PNSEHFFNNCRKANSHHCLRGASWASTTLPAADFAGAYVTILPPLARGRKLRAGDMLFGNSTPQFLKVGRRVPSPTWAATKYPFAIRINNDSASALRRLAIFNYCIGA